MTLATRQEMAADDRGLVHGGFVFSLLDHAAMLAVNEPTVVLGRATARFLRPVKVGEQLVAEAEVVAVEGRRRTVRCVARRGDQPVAEAELACVVPDRHVLDAEGER